MQEQVQGDCRQDILLLLRQLASGSAFIPGPFSMDERRAAREDVHHRHLGLFRSRKGGRSDQTA
eukprot:12466976-Alexandrium_andersonii.AAC.1